jgi:CheY-like chemotaxis protein
MSILIVEDNALSAKLLDHSLKRLNSGTVVTPNGLEALEILENNSSIRLVITDVMMPEMDGIQLLERIKNTPHLSHLPVIVCTVLRDKASIARSAALGCNHYLLKPFRIDDLRAKVWECLKPDTSCTMTKSDIMAQYCLTETTYIEMKNEFIKLLEGYLAVKRKEHQGDTHSDDAPDLENIHECAVLFGAGQLRFLLEKAREVHHPVDDHGLMGEMKKIIQLLSS